MLLWSLWCICLFELVFSFSSNIYQLVEMLHHIMILFLVIWGTSKLFQNLLHQFTFPLIVYCCSVAQSCLILCNPVDNSTPNFLSFTISQSLLRHISIESMMPSNHLSLCCPLLLLPSIFPASGSLPMSWLFASRGQSIRASASALVLPMNIQDWFPLGLTGLISLLSMGLWRLWSILQHHSLKASILRPSAFFMVQLTYATDYWKSHSFA